jgi:hypothetical protein
MQKASKLQSILTGSLVAVALLAIGLRGYTLLHLPLEARCGSDFPVFYASGKLLGTPSLYSWKAMQDMEQRIMGCSSGYAVFIRLPYFAALMKPWSLLPFWPAFWLWRAISVCAIGVFVWLWPGQRRWALVACAWSLPLHGTITGGQDEAFLLMWLAISVFLVSRGREFAAGSVLAMCAAKFHLFLLLPLFLWRRPHLLKGFLVACAAVLASCFAVCPTWPKQFLTAIQNNIDPQPSGSANLRSLAHSNLTLELLLAGAVVLVAFYVIRRGDFEYGLNAVLAGGVLVSHHGANTVLLVPVALTVAWHPIARYSKVPAIYLASPFAYASPAWFQALMILVLLVVSAYEVRKYNQHKDGIYSPVSGQQANEIVEAAIRPPDPTPGR